MLDSTRKSVRLSLQISRIFLLMFASLLLMAGCSKAVEKKEDIRPVRAMQLVPDGVNVAAEFSGEVRPRIESRLSFRVGGKIISRKVDVGAHVKRGQILMQLDPQDLQLLQSQANAGVKAAESNRDLAKAEYQRYRELHEKNFVSLAVLDAKNSTYKAAQASMDQAFAAYKEQTNQAGYTSLVADVDGVVTSIDAEIGQVVSSGTAVVRVAELGEKEVVIGIPEDKVEALRRIADVRVRLWAKPQVSIPGKIREISPIADSATRTYLTKIAMPSAPAEVKLGMTAYVQFTSKTPSASIKVPLTALFQEKGVSSVWIIENGVVRLVPVTIGNPSGNEFFLTSGVVPGQTVVTAGVNQLKPGQKVRLLEEDSDQKKNSSEGMSQPSKLSIHGITPIDATSSAPSAGIAK